MLCTNRKYLGPFTPMPKSLLFPLKLNPGEVLTLGKENIEPLVIIELPNCTLLGINVFTNFSPFCIYYLIVNYLLTFVPKGPYNLNKSE